MQHRLLRGRGAPVIASATLQARLRLHPRTRGAVLGRCLQVLVPQRAPGGPHDDELDRDDCEPPVGPGCRRFEARTLGHRRRRDPRPNLRWHAEVSAERAFVRGPPSLPYSLHSAHFLVRPRMRSISRARRVTAAQPRSNPCARRCWPRTGTSTLSSVRETRFTEGHTHTRRRRRARTQRRSSRSAVVSVRGASAAQWPVRAGRAFRTIVEPHRCESFGAALEFMREVEH